MKNITVSVPDEVYRCARVRAAERGRSVSALVADYLAGLGQQDERFAALRAQQHKTQRGIRSFTAGDRLNRDAVHQRAIR
jgi:plasmid stability protein